MKNSLIMVLLVITFSISAQTPVAFIVENDGSSIGRKFTNYVQIEVSSSNDMTLISRGDAIYGSTYKEKKCILVFIKTFSPNINTSTVIFSYQAYLYQRPPGDLLMTGNEPRLTSGKGSASKSNYKKIGNKVKQDIERAARNNKSNF